MVKKYNSEVAVEFFQKVFQQTEDDFCGCRQVWVRNEEGKFQLLFFGKDYQFEEKLSQISVSNKCNYYVTPNSHYADWRGIDYLFGIDNIVIDIDNHTNPNVAAVNFECIRLIYFLLNDSDTLLPCVTAIVLTGRGLQLWWHFDMISSKLCFLCKVVIEDFIRKIKAIISNNNIDLVVDETASKNISGLVRLPCTYNTVAHRTVTYEVYTDCVYKFNDILSEYDISLSSDKKKTRKNTYVKSDTEYKALQNKRIGFIEQYVQRLQGNCEGMRNNILLGYYNACVQVIERSIAVNKTIKLNKSFVKPLDCDLSYIFNYIDNLPNGYLKFSNETFMSLLMLSDEEKERYKFMNQTNKAIKRADEKEERRKAKEERNKTVVQLAVAGLKQQEIADKVGCSVRTIKTILKDFNQSEFKAMQCQHLYRTTAKSKQDIADILGVSLKQVYNYLKMDLNLDKDNK